MSERLCLAIGEPVWCHDRKNRRKKNMSNTKKKATGSTSKKKVQRGAANLIGKQVMVWCGIYIYTGVLVSVTPDELVLDNASVVYETGPLCGPPQTAQKLPAQLSIRLSAIECYYKAPLS
ncbi:MAG: hypothetical protein Q8S00_32525 [Deltaproteobacteria bacterium]|nr:hypothetical protein [Deltaproteobacteria bacterium]